jgi:DNA mismatch repair ATPase MutS
VYRYTPHVLTINTFVTDISTAENLELLSNAHNPASVQSLYGVLNHTKTPSGARLLRSNILQPSCDAETIHLRQECVKALLPRAVCGEGVATRGSIARGFLAQLESAASPWR